MSVVRVAGVILPHSKHINIALSYIYGIGSTRAKAVCSKLGLELHTKVSTLSEDDVDRLNTAVNEYTIEGDLRREIGMNIKRLVDIKSYRGIRHRKGLPVRGQRTQTNAKTRKKGKGGSKKGGKGKK